MSAARDSSQIRRRRDHARMSRIHGLFINRTAPGCAVIRRSATAALDPSDEALRPSGEQPNQGFDRSPNSSTVHMVATSANRRTPEFPRSSLLLSSLHGSAARMQPEHPYRCEADPVNSAAPRTGGRGVAPVGFTIERRNRVKSPPHTPGVRPGSTLRGDERAPPNAPAYSPPDAHAGGEGRPPLGSSTRSCWVRDQGWAARQWRS